MTEKAAAQGSVAYDTVEEFWAPDAVDALAEARRHQDPRGFAEEFCVAFGLTGSAVPTASARDALTRYLRALRLRSPRTEVLLSAFNCAAVADAVHAAGLRVRTFDLATTDGSFDPDAIQAAVTDACLALVIPHLFGVPCDLGSLPDRCAQLGVALVEDCSQTVGATLGGRPVGSFGDAAVFSFGYDKPLSLGGGGMLLSRDRAEVAVPEPSEPVADRQLLDALRVFLVRRRALISTAGHASTVAERQRIYAQSAAAPGPRPIGPLRAALGSWQLGRYPAVVRERDERANAVAAAGLVTWPVPADAEPAWLKQKVLVAESADDVAVGLQRHGFRAGPFNWHEPVADDVRRSVARYTALWSRQGLDVPVHQNMPRAAVSSMIEMIRHG
ncbi:DegT/DnrJ/EryC1/StrS family aminotransferase [Streptomyces sp. GZWMJZ-114]|uniref:DegT/DnrJ/EryC1/StrS family aminotransferase n=1 Tax=Streptomyces sp. GZWMJZ-114 TaxID=2494734 RepID=UPI0013E93C1E|nr:DegT/DnrJ/EryC1/StrS family aminotransferase [Streptomyces sp. GZWMJZ-114]